jgi:hypothetical protein
MVVAMDFGKLRRMPPAVRMGINLKKPWSMALVHVAVVRLKHEVWKNLMALLLIYLYSHCWLEVKQKFIF